MSTQWKFGSEGLICFRRFKEAGQILDFGEFIEWKAQKFYPLRRRPRALPVGLNFFQRPSSASSWINLRAFSVTFLGTLMMTFTNSSPPPSENGGGQGLSASSWCGFGFQEELSPFLSLPE